MTVIVFFRRVSPHMVNVHQFYPEIAFSTDKGTVGEVVEVPKSSSRSTKKSLSKIGAQACFGSKIMLYMKPLWSYLFTFRNQYLKQTKRGSRRKQFTKKSWLQNAEKFCQPLQYDSSLSFMLLQCRKSLHYVVRICLPTVKAYTAQKKSTKNCFLLKFD